MSLERGGWYMSRTGRFYRAVGVQATGDLSSEPEEPSRPAAWAGALEWESTRQLNLRRLSEGLPPVGIIRGPTIKQDKRAGRPKGTYRRADRSTRNAAGRAFFAKLAGL